MISSREGHCSGKRANMCKPLLGIKAMTWLSIADFMVMDFFSTHLTFATLYFSIEVKYDEQSLQQDVGCWEVSMVPVFVYACFIPPFGMVCPTCLPQVALQQVFRPSWWEATQLLQHVEWSWQAADSRHVHDIAARFCRRCLEDCCICWTWRHRHPHSSIVFRQDSNLVESKPRKTGGYSKLLSQIPPRGAEKEEATKPQPWFAKNVRPQVEPKRHSSSTKAASSAWNTGANVWGALDSEMLAVVWPEGGQRPASAIQRERG